METRKPIIMLGCEISTPPFSKQARVRAGIILDDIQHGALPPYPVLRPMPAIGQRCYEVRLKDSLKRIEWRILFHIADDAIVLLDIFEKKTQRTPQRIINTSRARLKRYMIDRKGGC